MMRTTLDIDEEKLMRLMHVLGVSSKTQAINVAIEEALRARARARLKALAGKVRLAEDWRELRDLERRP
jgi:Arc/MetJ family transcription regulator